MSGIAIILNNVDFSSKNKGRVHPFIDVTSLSINGLDTINSNVTSAKYTVDIIPSNASDKTVTWSSNDTSIATIANDGTATFTHSTTDKTVVLTATSSNGKSATKTIRVVSSDTINRPTNEVLFNPVVRFNSSNVLSGRNAGTLSSFVVREVNDIRVDGINMTAINIDGGISMDHDTAVTIFNNKKATVIGVAKLHLGDDLIIDGGQGTNAIDRIKLLLIDPITSAFLCATKIPSSGWINNKYTNNGVDVLCTNYINKYVVYAVTADFKQKLITLFINGTKLGTVTIDIDPVTGLSSTSAAYWQALYVKSTYPKIEELLYNNILTDEQITTVSQALASAYSINI